MKIVFQLGSGVIGVAAGNSVFTNRLIASLPAHAPGVSAHQAVQVGAYDLAITFGNHVRGVREAYLVGIKDAWILTLALCGVAFFVGIVAPRVSILGKMGVDEHGSQDQEKRGWDG
jgi:MFS transporter, DHA2 family, glioxin efflux transporter